MNGRRNQPGSANASDDEIRRNYELIRAAKELAGGRELPPEVLDTIVAPVPCRRTKLRLKAAAEGRRFRRAPRDER